MTRQLHVEVTEVNIDLFGLDKLTGNSKEDLLDAAKRAAEEGYVLSCRIPDPQESQTVNIFDHFESESAPEVEEQKPDENVQVTVVTDHEGTAVSMDEEGVEIINGEIVEVDDD